MAEKEKNNLRAGRKGENRMIKMDRRQFLSLTGAACASLAFGEMAAGKPSQTAGMYVFDAHEHPDHFHRADSTDTTSTVDMIRSLQMNGSSFSAVGDWPGNSPPPVSFEELRTQLQYVKDLEASGKVIIVRKASDLPNDAFVKKINRSNGPYVPRAILSVEGAGPIVADLTYPDDLEELENRMWTLYEDGVRLMTIMHDQVNGIGDVMTSDPVNNGLTEMGAAIVEHMIELGMVIDVAHAHIGTLEDIAEIARAFHKPIIDSHTSPSHLDNPYPDPTRPDKPLNVRVRSWLEIEMVVEAGGLICTWPLKISRPGKPSNRETILDWANETLMLQQRFGINYIGLGTDAGGGPPVVDGWTNIMNIPDLAATMQDIGLGISGIAAYMGGNFLKVLNKCIAKKIKTRPA